MRGEGRRVMRPLSPGFIKVIRVVDAFSNRCGNVLAWMILPLTAGLTYEVIARYVFNAPTLWAYDMSYMLYGSHFMLGAAYALVRGAHVRTDFFYEKYSDRQKGLVDATAYLVFFFPALIMFFAASIDDAYYSWRIGELSEQSAWRPILWPFKATVPLAALLLLIQGLSEFLKSLYAAMTGRQLVKPEVIQI
jgi:TRAP-type mannitol/chloroaromatic compound transport system permease small subunit